MNGRVEPPWDWQRGVALYFALQVAGAAAMGVGLGALWLVEPVLGRGVGAFTRSWAMAFVLVPLTFVPILAVWHRQVVRRCGQHPRIYRGSGVIIEIYRKGKHFVKVRPVTR